MRLKTYLSALLIFPTSLLFAQTQHSAYSAIGKGVATTFIHDYQSLGINNSALGWGTGFDNKNFAMGTSEFSFGVASDNLDKDKVRNAANGLYNTIRDRENSEFDLAKQRQAAMDYATSGFAVDASYNWFGAYFHNEKLGGIAVAIRENYGWYSQLNQQTTDLVFRGATSSYFDSLAVVFNGDTSMIANRSNLSTDTLLAVIYGQSSDPKLLSELTKGSEIKSVWNREYNFGYGRRILGQDSTFALYGGIGGRFIQSVAMFDFQSDDDGIRMYSSLSPFFDIDYGSVQLSNPSTLLENNGLLPSITGQGYGIDLSASAILLNKIKIAAAVNNVGSITYNRNVYTVNDAPVERLSVSGMTDYDLTESIQLLLSDGGAFDLVGKESHVVMNPATFRMGGSMELGKKIHVGVDFVAPFNRETPGSLQNAVMSVGGDFRPLPWLQLSAGYFGGGVYRHNIPLGVTFVLGEGAYEFGIASRDALSFFLDNANSVSGALGFARFRF